MDGTYLSVCMCCERGLSELPLLRQSFLSSDGGHSGIKELVNTAGLVG